MSQQMSAWEIQVENRGYDKGYNKGYDKGYSEGLNESAEKSFTKGILQGCQRSIMLMLNAMYGNEITDRIRNFVNDASKSQLEDLTSRIAEKPSLQELERSLGLDDGPK